MIDFSCVFWAWAKATVFKTKLSKKYNVDLSPISPNPLFISFIKLNSSILFYAQFYNATSLKHHSYAVINKHSWHSDPQVSISHIIHNITWHNHKDFNTIALEWIIILTESWFWYNLKILIKCLDTNFKIQTVLVRRELSTVKSFLRTGT